MQRQFLWHSLSNPVDTTLVQLQCTFSGVIDIALMEAAWGHTVAEQQALRSSVHWKDIATPLQIVHKQVRSRCVVIDTNTFPTVEAFLQYDRQQFIDLTKPAAFRIGLYVKSESVCDIVWSMSHVLLDGWSSTLVINQWVENYSLLLQGLTPTLKEVLPLSDHVRWNKQQDTGKLICFWDNYLPEHSTTSPLPYQKLSDRQLSPRTEASCKAHLSAARFDNLNQCLKSSHITLGAVLQGMFATAIHSKEDIGPIVFGTTVSGRHIDIRNINERVSMMINTIPIFVAFDSSNSVRSWLKQLQEDFFSSLPYSHASNIQLEAIRPNQKTLYNSLLVIENQSIPASTLEITVSDYRSDIVSNFDLTLVVVPGQDLALDLRYNSLQFDSENINKLLFAMINLLTDLPNLLDNPLSILEPYKAADAYSSKPISIKDDSAAGLPLTQLPAVVNESTNLLTLRLREIWCQVLFIDTLELTDNFFELGGTSLQAVTICSRVEKLLNIEIPATTLFEAPSIEKLIGIIANVQAGIRLSSIVVVNPNGTNPPIFIPFEQADMLMYQPLFVELGENQPVYGLRIPLNRYPSNDQLNDLASQIREIQGTEPFCLAGLSKAGLVAWDLAQRLNKSHCQADWLILFDSYGPDYPHLKPPVARLISIAAETIMHSLKLSGKVWAKTHTFFRKRTQRNSTQNVVTTAEDKEYRKIFTQKLLSRTNNEISLASLLLAEVFSDQSQRLKIINLLILRMSLWRFGSSILRIEFINFTQGLLINYCRKHLAASTKKSEPTIRALDFLTIDPVSLGEEKPVIQHMLTRFQDMYRNINSYKGRVLYCRAKKQPAGIVEDHLSGWATLFPDNVRIEIIPGNHLSLMKQPHVKILARCVSKAMAESTEFRTK